MICTDWRREVAKGEWMCECGCIPTGFDLDVVRKCLKTMADEIDRLRKLIADLAQEAVRDNV